MSKYRFGAPPQPGRHNATLRTNLPGPNRPPGSGRPPGGPPYYLSEAGCDEATANQGLNIDPACVSVPKLCNWTTLPNAVNVPAGTNVTMTTVSPIAQFFDIHAASFVVVNAADCTLNGRAIIKSVTFNQRQLEDFNFTDALPLTGLLIDSAFAYDQGPTSVNWFAGTQGNNATLDIVFNNICAFDVDIYATFFGNPTNTCPM